MKLKTLTTAILFATVPATSVFAAALDRSGQSMSAFLQPNNYFEAGISVLDPTVEGREAGTSETRRDIEDMGEDYYFPSAALKLQLTDNISFGLLYDQPFGADAKYHGSNVFVSDASNTILPTSSLASIRTSTIDKNVKIKKKPENKRKKSTGKALKVKNVADKKAVSKSKNPVSTDKTVLSGTAAGLGRLKR